MFPFLMLSKTSSRSCGEITFITTEIFFLQMDSHIMVYQIPSFLGYKFTKITIILFLLLIIEEEAIAHREELFAITI